MRVRSDERPGAPSVSVIDRLFGTDSLDASQVRRGWFGSIVSTVWLVYLIGPIAHRWTDGEPVRAVASAACAAGFGAAVLAAFMVYHEPDWDQWGRPRPRTGGRWLLLVPLLSIALVGLLGPVALPTIIFVAAVASYTLPARMSGLVAMAVSITMVAVPLLVPGWRHSDLPFYLAFIPVVVWVLRELGLRGRRLQEQARRQRAELAIVEERNRVARDVHDILGHSLTVITVKTELAQRLLDMDVDRARAELADVERLAREALAGVRDTVGGLREVSLRGELANAASALAAADIAATLPAPETLPAGDQALFGWVLREAVTNVVRHSAARHCTVTVTPVSIEVVDDGRGIPDGRTGSGLTGLRERLRAAGATLTLSTPAGGGTRVRATVALEQKGGWDDPASAG